MTKPKHTIVLQSEDQPQIMETWSSLTSLCNAHPDFEYNKIRRKSFPFKHKGYWFFKIAHEMNILKTELS